MSLHVVPVHDLIEHLDEDCECGPEIQYVDPVTGETYASGPLVIHHSLDGRDALEW